jgi:hypothetical protein
MAEYKGIKGFKVQTVSTDPAASILATGAWASGGNLNTGRSSVGSSTSGSQTASLVFGGQASDPALSDNTEQYNGTSWTEVADLNQIRAGLAGVGTTTAAAAAMGDSREIPSAPNVYYTQHEQWNGSSWTETTDVNAGRSFAFSFGTAPAFLVVGGYGTPGFTAKATAEEWNGSGWTEVADLNTARIGIGGAGTTTAGIAAGGPSGQTEQWNGSSWTEVGDFTTGRGAGMCAGTNTAALAFGGSPVPGGNGVLTEEWNGTSWTELNDLSTGRDYFGGSGTTTSALAFGGNPGYKTDTEEWTTTPAPSFQKENLGQVFYNSTSDAFKVTRIVTGTGAWASGGTLNTGRQYMGAAGISDTSALIFSGTSPATGVTESYDGSTWTEVNDMSTGRGYLGGGAGTQTAAIAVGGSSPTNPATSGTTEIWDGTSWTTVSSLTRGAVAPQSTVYGSTTGITTSALYIGGGEGTGTDTLTLTEAYNGTSWAEVGDLTTAVSYGAGIGKSDTDALLVTGINWAPGSAINSETNMYYNGTSWTELANVNTARAFLGGGTYGSSTDALIFGGRNQGPSAVYAITESWNGTSWTEVADLGTARMTQGGSGTSASAIYAGGSPYLTITEEWLQPSSTQNQTLTAS